MDSVDTATRSKIMAKVRSVGNKSTELKMLCLLRQNKLKGWRRHYKIEGKPDFVWTTKKIALFVDGCFWHGCPHCNKMPKSNEEYWTNKIYGNRLRDNRISRLLRRKGWKVIRVWECKIDTNATINKIASAYKSR